MCIVFSQNSSTTFSRVFFFFWRPLSDPDKVARATMGHCEETQTPVTSPLCFLRASRSVAWSFHGATGNPLWTTRSVQESVVWKRCDLRMHLPLTWRLLWTVLWISDIGIISLPSQSGECVCLTSLDVFWVPGTTKKKQGTCTYAFACWSVSLIFCFFYFLIRNVRTS